VETDPLGAADPYSTSKAMSDLLTQSWIKSHPDARIAIARAGNVIGGGDVASNRLLPDLLKAFSQGKIAQVRSPQAVRPWQHVLDCLNGYLQLAEALIVETTVPPALNFGPDSRSTLNVREVSDVAAKMWGESADWALFEGAQFHESEFLTLDSARAKEALGWREKLSPIEAIHWTVEWEKRVFRGEEPLAVTLDQVDRFIALEGPLSLEYCQVSPPL